MKMTQAEYDAIQKKRAPTKQQKIQALGRLKAGVMNNTEKAYAEHLEWLRHTNQIVWYRFECMTFKLAHDTRYTPDFIVMLPNGLLEAHEVKGYWADDARVKIKVAADIFPIKFIAIKKKSKKDGGGWQVEQF